MPIPQVVITPFSFIAIAAGAVLGAWLRWGLGLWLNAHAARMPWGTLAANLAGGYLVGLVLGLLALNPHWPDWVRLAVITGFLGALTTFSTFSAETVALLHAGRLATALGYAGLSLFGSFALTAAGLATVELWQRAG